MQLTQAMAVNTAVLLVLNISPKFPVHHPFYEQAVATSQFQTLPFETF